MPRVLQSDRRLITSPWQKPMGPVKIDWKQAPRGMTHCCLCSDDTFRELVNDRATLFYTNDLSFPQPTLNPTPAGIGFYTGTAAVAGGGQSIYYPCAQGPAQWTMEVLVYATNNPGRYCGMIDSTPASGTFDRLLGRATTPSSALIYIYDGGVRTLNGNTVLVAGKVYHVVGVADGSTLSIYVNGVLDATPLPVANGGYTGYTNPVFVVGYGNPTSNMNGTTTDTIIHAIFANQAWSAEEVKQRYLDPYGFLVPVEGDVGVTSLAAPSVISGTGAVTEAPDVASGSGTVLTFGTGAVTETADTASGSGTVLTFGTGAVTEASDTVSSTGLVITPGTGAVTEAPDTASGTGVVALIANGAVTETADTVSGTGTLQLAGTGAVTEAADTVSGVANIKVSGIGTLLESADILVGGLTTVPVLFGNINVAIDVTQMPSIQFGVENQYAVSLGVSSSPAITISVQ